MQSRLKYPPIRDEYSSRNASCARATGPYTRNYQTICGDVVLNGSVNKIDTPKVADSFSRNSSGKVARLSTSTLPTRSSFSLFNCVRFEMWLKPQGPKTKSQNTATAIDCNNSVTVRHRLVHSMWLHRNSEVYIASWFRDGPKVGTINTRGQCRWWRRRRRFPSCSRAINFKWNWEPSRISVAVASLLPCHMYASHQPCQPQRAGEPSPQRRVSSIMGKCVAGTKSDIYFY